MKRKIIGSVLIGIGLITIGSAFYMKYVTYRKQQQMISSFEKSIENTSKKGNSESAAGADETAGNNSVTNKDDSDTDVNGVVGIMKIPKINLKVAIGEGVDMDTLKCAVGHFPDTAMPGEKGNFCVAGHRSYTYSEYFNRLNEVAKGDEITVESKKGTFKYKVDDIKVVLPSEVSVLNSTEDATLTLVTCTPPRIATHRLIVKAKLED